LFEKRANNIRQGGEVSFPGGEFNSEVDKNFVDTAIRETSEELGIEKEKIILIGKLGSLFAPMGVIIEAYIGLLKIKSISELKIDPLEVEKIFILPVSFFEENQPEEYYVRVEVHSNKFDENGTEIKLLPVHELGLPEKYASPWRGGKHRVLVYKSQEEIIWGLTAELVFDFINLAYDK
jgi:8-oxo-dGTP pyrophosphatase MutT (NUDIX family)